MEAGGAHVQERRAVGRRAPGGQGVRRTQRRQAGEGAWLGCGYSETPTLAPPLPPLPLPPPLTPTPTPHLPPSLTPTPHLPYSHPHSPLPPPQVAFARAMALGGEAGAQYLSRHGLVDQAIEYAVESANFTMAFELAQTGAKGKEAEVHLKYAMYLEDEGEFAVSDVYMV